MSFVNDDGQLVGFNVEMAHQLAKDLGVSLEFVPIDLGEMAAKLEEDYCDIVMTTVPVIPEFLSQVSLSVPYMPQTLAFLVKDYRRNEFNSRDAIQRLEAPRIGISKTAYYQASSLISEIRQYLPQATLVPLDSRNEFFQTKDEELDAMLITAEEGYAWRIIYPHYAVAIPQPDIKSIPIAYAMAKGDREMLDFVNAWIELKKIDNTIESLYEYWIEGKLGEKQPPRWSIIRDVLGWVE
jgi:ABC-type amino acid transport substrate-binding protein